jgi:ABC-type antimicrobial peptide transport system permease subunit
MELPLSRLREIWLFPVGTKHSTQFHSAVAGQCLHCAEVMFLPRWSLMCSLASLAILMIFKNFGHSLTPTYTLRRQVTYWLLPPSVERENESAFKTFLCLTQTLQTILGVQIFNG